MNLPNLEELSFLVVRAFPKDSKIGLDFNTAKIDVKVYSQLATACMACISRHFAFLQKVQAHYIL